jgi:hypothetical protein
MMFSPQYPAPPDPRIPGLGLGFFRERVDSTVVATLTGSSCQVCSEDR